MHSAACSSRSLLEKGLSLLPLPGTSTSSADCMDQRVADLELLVAELRGEIGQCRLEIARLRHRLEGAGSGGAEEESGGSGERLVRGRANSPSGSYSLVGESRLTVTEVGAARGPEQITRVAPDPQSWTERETICVEIGRWIVRCLAELPRGPSGRDRLVLSSRVWLVVRDYEGRVRQPALIFHRFSDCRPVVKRGQCLGDSIFVGLPSLRELRVVAASAGIDLAE